MMQYDYTDFRKEIDMHNKCCGGLFWCIRDICGIICAILTWLLILYAEFVVMSVILIPSPYLFYSIINMVIFQMCAFLAFASHLRTMFTDPVSIIIGCFQDIFEIIVFEGCGSQRKCYQGNDKTNGF